MSDFDLNFIVLHSDALKCAADLLGGSMRWRNSGESGFGSRIKLRFHLSAPPFGVFVVHLFHLFCDVRVLFYHVPRHCFYHVVPRFP